MKLFRKHRAPQTRMEYRQSSRRFQRNARTEAAMSAALQFMVDNPQYKGLNRKQRRDVIRGLRRHNDGSRRRP